MCAFAGMMAARDRGKKWTKDGRSERAGEEGGTEEICVGVKDRAKKVHRGKLTGYA